MFRRISNLIFKIFLKFSSATKRADLMKRKFYKIGDNVELYTTNFGTEPWLISIGNNVTVAADVAFITHDVSCYNVARFLDVEPGYVDKIGSITLDDNCFIGAKSILMPNCSVGKNSIIAAGSVVTKRIPDNEVWGGNPAHYIMSMADYATRVVNKSKDYPWITEEKMTPEDSVKIRQKYFF